MTKCLSGCGQGHVTHLYILEPGHIFGLDVARHFKFGLQIELLKFLSILGHVTS